MTQIKVDRLSRLAALLENGAAEKMGLRFDLGSWGEAEAKRGGFLWLERNICNTAACAVGLACVSGEFSSDNLKFNTYLGQIYPEYSGQGGWEAVMLFFGLTKAQALTLFSEREYSGATVGPEAERLVAKRIRDFVAESAEPKKEQPHKPSVKKAVDDIKRKALESA